MFNRIKTYLMENIDSIAASMAALNAGDTYSFIER